MGQVLLFGQLQFELLLEVSCVHCVYSYACLMFHVLGTLSRLATALGGVPDKLACDERRCHNSMGGLINSAQVLTMPAKSKQCCSFLIEKVL